MVGLDFLRRLALQSAASLRVSHTYRTTVKAGIPAAFFVCRDHLMRADEHSGVPPGTARKDREGGEIGRRTRFRS